MQAKKPPRDFWTLPGGSLGKGETLVSCISREIFEEICIAFEIDKMLFVRELINSSRHRIEFYFSTKELDNKNIYEKITPCNEIKEVRFFALEELKSVTLKPNCLPYLIQEIMDKSNIFPRYFGNVD